MNEGFELKKLEEEMDEHYKKVDEIKTKMFKIKLGRCCSQIKEMYKIGGLAFECELYDMIMDLNRYLDNDKIKVDFLSCCESVIVCGDEQISKNFVPVVVVKEMQEAGYFTSKVMDVYTFADVELVSLLRDLEGYEVGRYMSSVNKLYEQVIEEMI